MKSCSKVVMLNFYNMTCSEVLAVLVHPPPPQFYIFSFLLFLCRPFLFDFLPPISSCPDVSPSLSSLPSAQAAVLLPVFCPSFRFVVWCLFFPRLISIHFSEDTLLSLPASLFFFPASRWQRHSLAPDPVVTSFPSCAFSFVRYCCGVPPSSFVFPCGPFWLASLLSKRTRQCPNHSPYVTTLPPVPGILRGLFVPRRWDRRAALKRR